VVEQVNRALPDGAQLVLSAEMVARGLRGFLDGTAHVPRVTEQMHLPAFKYSQVELYAWPLVPTTTVITVLVNP